MDTTKATEQIRRGDEARKIITDPLWEEAFRLMEDHITEMWRETAADEEDQRKVAYHLIRLLPAFRAQFEAFIVNGKLAERLLSDM